MADNWTLFRPASSSGGAASGDYVKDAFQDISLLATNNSGLTSTASTNPLNQLFANDDAPKYAVRTLYIKNIKLIEDTSLWVSSKPTYKIEWNSCQPGVFGYVAGNIRLRNFPNGLSVDVRNIDDLVGISGKIRRVIWLLNCVTATGTADIVLDGADSGSDASFGGESLDAVNHAINKYRGVVNAASNSTNDIHDYRLTANETDTLSIVGAIVYFENSTTDIACFPGSTYNNKTKITSANEDALALPTISSRLGAKNIITKESSGCVISTLEVAGQETIGIGTNATNTIDVTAGTGQSFLAGMGIVSVAGTSFYVGSISSISTDALTVQPVLPFGLSGPLYKAWYSAASATVGASLFKKLEIFDPGLASRQGDANGFYNNSIGDYYYQHPLNLYRAWGDNMTSTGSYGYPGLGFTAGAFLQIDGRFCAAEAEFDGAGILHGTFSINGVPGYGFNEGLTGSLKKTIFTDAGPGWNSIVFKAGSSFGNAVLSKITLYERATTPGVTAGALAKFDSFMNSVERTAVNASYMQLGGLQRIYADQLHLTGSWVRGTTHTSAGGVHYSGSSTNSALSFQYYGKNVGLIGTMGTSVAIAIDGVAANPPAFNKLLTVATTGFHSVAVSMTGGTTIIGALDFQTPQTGELENLQKFTPREELPTIPTVFYQSDTPRNPKSGDWWFQFPSVISRILPVVWVYAGGLWNKLGVLQASDDPNLLTFVRAYGSTTLTGAEGVQDGESFNGASWNAIVASSLGIRSSVSGCDNAYASGIHIVDGANTSSATAAFHARFNKLSWVSLANRATARCSSSSADFNGFLYSSTGVTTKADPSTGVITADKWNGSAWSTGTAWTAERMNAPSYVVGAKLYTSHGVNPSSSTTNTVWSRDAADAVTVESTSAVTSASQGGGSLGINRVKAIIFSLNNEANNATSYSFNGTSFSSALTAAYTQAGASANGGAFNSNSGVSFNNGGYDASVALASTQSYNDVSFTALAASTTARLTASSGVI